MPRHRGLYHQDWDVCQRCGFVYPIGMLTIQLGLKVCTKTCVDNLDVMYRPLAIGRVFEHDDREFIRDKDEQNTTTGWDDLVF